LPRRILPAARRQTAALTAAGTRPGRVFPREFLEGAKAHDQEEQDRLRRAASLDDARDPQLPDFAQRRHRFRFLPGRRPIGFGRTCLAFARGALGDEDVFVPGTALRHVIGFFRRGRHFSRRLRRCSPERLVGLLHKILERVLARHAASRLAQEVHRSGRSPKRFRSQGLDLRHGLRQGLHRDFLVPREERVGQRGDINVRNLAIRKVNFALKESLG
jgi:hypothetical protein